MTYTGTYAFKAPEMYSECKTDLTIHAGIIVCLETASTVIFFRLENGESATTQSIVPSARDA